jgi:hypothetical protein
MVFVQVVVVHVVASVIVEVSVIVQVVVVRAVATVIVQVVLEKDLRHLKIC